jgi:hypothetical protein
MFFSSFPILLCRFFKRLFRILFGKYVFVLPKKKITQHVPGVIFEGSSGQDIQTNITREIDEIRRKWSQSHHANLTSLAGRESRVICGARRGELQLKTAKIDVIFVTVNLDDRDREIVLFKNKKDVAAYTKDNKLASLVGATVHFDVKRSKSGKGLAKINGASLDCARGTPPILYPTDIKDYQTSILLAWMAELEQHRTASEKFAKTVAESLPDKDERDANWHTHFKRGVMKKRQLLPQCTLNPRHVTIEGYNTAAEVYNSCCEPGAKVNPSNPKIEDPGDPDKNAFVKEFFDANFPGIRDLGAFQTGKMKFANKIKTDGVFVSIICTRKPGPNVGGGGGDRLANDSRLLDLNSPNPPQQHDPGKDVLWAIDPGNRDMAVAVNVTDADTEGQIEKLSTRRHLFESKRKVHARKTIASMKKIEWTDASGNRTNLHAAISGTDKPSSKTADPEEFIAYIDHWTKEGLVDKVAAVKMSKAWRQRRGWIFAWRDRSLDNFCLRLTKNQRKGEMGTTYVAFGAANVSSGMGHASAPHKRLRTRLEAVHGAKVTLIEEFRTSVLLRGTNLMMKTPTKSPPPHPRPKGWYWTKTHQMYGVLFHKGPQYTKGVYVHRDVNACKNIGDIYKCLAKYGRRPLRFTRFRRPNGQSQPKKTD